MLEAFEIVPAEEMQKLSATYRVTLRYDEREKSRYKTQTDCGKPLGWFVPRGHVLAEGEGLRTKDEAIVQVLAAIEKVSRVTSDSAHLLMRAAYHLGNRHVPLQVDAHALSFLSDYVLDDMVRGLGLNVALAQQPFTPESGAYHSHHGQHNHGDNGHATSASSHSHSHSHSHSQSHSHSHGHSHS